MRTSSPSWSKRAGATFFALVAGCTVGPNWVRPAPPKVSRFTPQPITSAPMVADGKTQRFEPGHDVDPRWWRMFSSPALDALVSEAMAHNATLESARATLSRNQNLLRAGSGVFYPQLDAHVSASRQKFNIAPGAIPSTTFNLFTASGSVSYAIDLWGGERRQVEALGAQVAQQHYTLAAAYVMLSGNITSTVIAQAAYRAEIEATKASLAVEREQLRITEARVKGGAAPYSDVLTLRSQIASTEATLPPLEQKIDAATHLLATLVGVTPGEWRGSALRLDELKLPPNLPVSLPSALVRQRPDILMAEAAAHAANANIGVATAAMLPNLTLNGNYGVSTNTIAGLTNPASAVWSAGAAIAQPLFHGGTLYYQRKAAIDQRNAVLADYRQTVLSAFAQVADSLRALEHDAETVGAQTEAVESAEGALRIIQANYSAGIATYLQVLIADIQYLQARIAYLEATAQRMQDTVALYVALGGGWWNLPPKELTR